MADYLYTIELQKRREELRAELSALMKEVTEAKGNFTNNGMHLLPFGDAQKTECGRELALAEDSLSQWVDDYQEELDQINSLVDRIWWCWESGGMLIPEDSFVDYAMDLAHDIGAIGDNSEWLVIDWDATADGLRNDYQTVEFQEETYLVRS